MEMKTRLLVLPLLLLLVASLAACGGGSQKVPADAVAVVNGTPITIAQFNNFFTQAKAIATAQGQTVTPGTSQYTLIRNQVVAYLVQVTEVEQQAKKEGVSESSSAVNDYISNLAKTQFQGSMSKLTAALKKQGLTMDTAKQEVFVNLLVEKLKTKVTSSANVTEADEKAYFNSPTYQLTRSVEHILVKKKSLADQLEQQLKNGASFAKLAKKYSKDPGSAAQGGKYTATKGREVPAYDDVAFSLKTGQLSPPVDATSSANGSYGWFIIKALAPVPTFSDVQSTIKETLLQQKQNTLWQRWLDDLTKQGKVTYQSGYAPPTTTAIPTTSLPPPTTG
jgi:parvulin-like peptidyl-prolyl isomerase